MLAILAPIFVFGLVIFVHELGHFLAAKAFGVYTPRFSIGFGPALWRRRRGETEYVVAALPLGGYVRMASRHDEASAFLEGGSEEGSARAEDNPQFDPNAMIPFGPKPVPENRWFESKPLWARLVILLAGVTMNFALGVVVAIGLAYHVGNAVTPTRVVGTVRPVGGRPVLTAIQPGDTIVRVNDQPVRSWEDVQDAILASRGRVTIRTNRAADSVSLSGPGAPTADAVASAIDYMLPAVIGDTVPDEPAARAGLGPGDSIVAINGQAVHSWNEMVVIVARSAGKPTTFVLARNGGPDTVSVIPKPMDAIDPVTGLRARVGKIGAYAKDVRQRSPMSFAHAIPTGVRAAWVMSTMVIGGVWDMVTRRRSVKELGGIIEITRVSVQAARSGLETLFYLIALLSVNLAVINLLPIPILDGGQILINVVESAKGSPLSDRTREYVLRFGLAVIAILVIFGLVNDTLRLLR
jgi:regulator of sigma E protease